MKVGPTGKYPRGKLNTDDEGELALRIGVSNGTVVMDFGKSVMWVGLGPDDARNIAAKLIEKAEELERKLS